MYHRAKQSEGQLAYENIASFVFALSLRSIHPCLASPSVMHIVDNNHYISTVEKNRPGLILRHPHIPIENLQ